MAHQYQPQQQQQGHPSAEQQQRLNGSLRVLSAFVTSFDIDISPRRAVQIDDVASVCPGDHLTFKVQGSGIWHHGIVVFQDPALDGHEYRGQSMTVIHLDGSGYREDSFSAWYCDHGRRGLFKVTHTHQRHTREPSQVVQIARFCKLHGAPEFSPLEWTCDSFANFCAEDGVYTQNQAQTALQLVCDRAVQGASTILTNKLNPGRKEAVFRQQNAEFYGSDEDEEL